MLAFIELRQRVFPRADPIYGFLCGDTSEISGARH